jgi:hypothetical protein
MKYQQIWKILLTVSTDVSNKQPRGLIFNLPDGTVNAFLTYLWDTLEYNNLSEGMPCLEVCDNLPGGMPGWEPGGSRVLLHRLHATTSEATLVLI